MLNIQKIKNIIEALLIASEKGLSVEDIRNAITNIDTKDIDEAIRLLKEEYSLEARAFTISELAGRFRIVTKPEYLSWINNLYKKEHDRLTGPSLETLAIIAYRQPVTRGEIEDIRGVDSGGVVKNLLDKNLIRIKGRRDTVGRPLLYGTSEKFLEVFGLNSLNDLPLLKEFKEEDLEFKKDKEALVSLEGKGRENGNKEVKDSAEGN